MANTAQAKKRAKQARKHQLHNTSLRSRMRTSLKKVAKAIESGNKSDAQEAFHQAVPHLDGMVNKKLIHKNKAARHKSRLSAGIKSIEAK